MDVSSYLCATILVPGTSTNLPEKNMQQKYVWLKEFYGTYGTYTVNDTSAFFCHYLSWQLQQIKVTDIIIFLILLHPQRKYYFHKRLITVISKYLCSSYVCFFLVSTVFTYISNILSFSFRTPPPMYVCTYRYHILSFMLWWWW